jgi:hypothetical protein
MSKKTVVIVNAGTDNHVPDETQNRWVERAQEHLEPHACVEVETSTEAVRTKLDEPEHSIDVVLFRSRGMKATARHMKAQHPELRVVIMSAGRSGVDEDKVVWVDKIDLDEDPATVHQKILG